MNLTVILEKFPNCRTYFIFFSFSSELKIICRVVVVSTKRLRDSSLFRKITKRQEPEGRPGKGSSSLKSESFCKLEYKKRRFAPPASIMKHTINFQLFTFSTPDQFEALLLIVLILCIEATSLCQIHNIDIGFLHRSERSTYLRLATWQNILWLLKVRSGQSLYQVLVELNKLDATESRISKLTFLTSSSSWIWSNGFICKRACCNFFCRWW